MERATKTQPGTISRRALIAAGGALGVSTLLPRAGAAQGAPDIQTPLDADGFEAPRHGLSIFGDLKYGPDFKHFDYVNPAAPKGGEMALQLASWGGNQNPNTFNTLNIYTQKGDGAAGMGLIYDSLMSGSGDEPDSLYGLVASSVQKSPDGLAYRFHLRKEVRFHDNSPLTADDVVFTLETLKSAKAHATYRQLLRQVENARAINPHLVEFRFAAGRSREMPLLVAGLPIFSKAYFSTRDFEASTLDSPLGSGSYKVEKADAGHSIRFRRVADYWGRDLPVTIGQGNFDVVRYEYFRDREAAFQAFTAGTFTYREEFTSVTWATRYNFPAVLDGRVKKDVIPDTTPSGTQGWFINTRRPQFRDPRVREAIALAFDFEWVNRNLMFGLYKRTTSYFENSFLKAEGAPSAEELALLEPFRGKVPDGVFSLPYLPPVSDGSGQDRNLLRRASQLLSEAGLVRAKGGDLRFADGSPLTVEFLENDESLSKHTGSIVKNLKLLGIEARIRVIDAAQFARRMQDFDFDVVMLRFSMSLAPGEGLRLFFGSEAAKTPSSRNLAGVADPVIDAMIAHCIAAKTRSELNTATHALDRLLRAGHYWIPAWYGGEHKIAFWDMFGMPERSPTYGFSPVSLWWYDAQKAKRIGK